MFSGFTNWASGNAVASSTSQAVAEPSSQQQASNSTGGGARQTAAFAVDLDSIHVPIDPDVRAFQSTVDLDSRLAERAFEGRRAWGHVTLDDVAREMDDLRMDKDVDEAIQTAIRKSFDTFIKKTIVESKEKPFERKVLTPARLSEIENRLKNDPSLQLDDEAANLAIDAPDGHAAAEVKMKLIRTYARIKKNSYELSQPTINNIEHRIDILKK